MLEAERMPCYMNKDAEISPMGEKKCSVQSINSQSLCSFWICLCSILLGF